MPKMIKFEEWKQSRMNSIPEDVDQENAVDSSAEMAQLIAKLDELQAERRKLMKDSQKLEAQLLDIDIQLTKNDIEKLELDEKREKIKKAIEISKQTKKEGRIRNEDGKDIETETSKKENPAPKSDEEEIDS